jgi:hypothetical protein
VLWTPSTFPLRKHVLPESPPKPTWPLIELRVSTPPLVPEIFMVAELSVPKPLAKLVAVAATVPPYPAQNTS